MTEAAEKKQQQNLVVLTATMVIITIIAGIVFVYAPFFSEHNSLKESIPLERQRNIIMGEIRTIENHLGFYQKMFSGDRGMSWFLQEVADLAGKEQVKVIAIKPVGTDTSSSYNKLSLVLDVAGTYQGIGKFVANLESSDKFMRVESMNIKRLDSDDDFDREEHGLKAFDVKAHMVISSVIWR